MADDQVRTPTADAPPGASAAEPGGSDHLPRRLVIGGEQVDAAAGATFPVSNPATEEVLAHVALAMPDDIDRAVRNARTAYDSTAWQGTSARQRGRMLLEMADRIEDQTESLARLETLDNGKTLFESAVDVRLAAATLRYFGGLADKIHGETIPVDGAYLNYTRREPVGVVGAIVPWNFPITQAAWKVAPALACGNAIVLKPSEHTPFTALRLAELALESGVPAGIFNCVPGFGGDAGRALVRHPLVDKIAFTGSTATGQSVMRDAAENVTRLTLELGGKSPNIIFADADLDAAVKGAFQAIFYGKGEVCAAGSRLLVEDAVYDDVRARLLERMTVLKPGDPLQRGTRLGALVSQAQRERVLRYIARGRDEGARLSIGGDAASVGGRGFFVNATLFEDVTPDMTIAREEIFGPVLAMMRFSDGAAGAVELANDTIYGLAAAVWSRDIKKALRTAHAIRAGTVWVNCYNAYDPASPFGGMKGSGFGRELGTHAIAEYTDVKSVWVDLA
jgi:acyl-CoA reductase-like NAD-dependent aldehyde dehydrogenase